MDPVTLQVVVGALRATCDEMGSVLIRAAYSANIKERHDLSTALFDLDGEMVMQAEHIPVHLGSMPDAVAAVKDRGSDPGDVWAVNDPYRGGTHLPDITLISPIYLDDGGAAEQIGFVASRAHHADVGGMSPASMPATSTELYQEGLVIPPVKIQCEGEVDTALLDVLLANMRSPEQRRADLRAQLAANRVGEMRARELAGRIGGTGLKEAMSEVLAYAERRVRARIAALPDGRYEASDWLEDDAAGGASDLLIKAAIEIEGDSISVDFKGTAAQTGGNLNCPLSVTKSATYFAVRVMTDPEIPASAGAYRPVSVAAPAGSVVNAQPPAAVVGGNVETSCRIADVLIAALGQATPGPAQGQGTMNNLTLGNPDFTYYETIGGGQGACPGAAGPSGIHVTMTNTLNTPIEALELEHPLRLRTYALRRDTGGAGRQRGGDGLVREIEALEAMHYSLLTERRRHGPRGAAGGGDGATGRNLVNGTELPSKAEGELEAGDVLRIETPGGGGYAKLGS